MGTARREETGTADAVTEQGEGSVREILTVKLHQVSVRAVSGSSGLECFYFLRTLNMKGNFVLAFYVVITHLSMSLHGVQVLMSGFSFLLGL